jgi:thioredoxin:protein disulfide reductase
MAAWREHAPWVAPATLLLGGIYLGFLERSAAGNRWFTALKWAVGTAAIVFGALLTMRVYQQGQEQVAMVWEPYSEQRVAEALSAGHPVMFDFYADWCEPCHKLDRETFSDSRVIAATEGFVRLKVDLTDFSPETESLRQRYEVVGVPTVVFLGPDGHERPAARVVGFLGPDKFLERVAGVE